MTTPDPDRIAQELTEQEGRWVLATPLQEPADSGFVAYMAGDRNGGGAFAGFARRNPFLFQRILNVSGTQFLYRLTKLGLAVRDHLLSNKGE